jgi:EmrB/QacA subfamily drug resistance transporter
VKSQSPTSGTVSAERESAERYHVRRWWTLGVISLATFMTQLDNIIVVIALPTIKRELGLNYAQLEWVISSYILVFASLILFGGRMADRLGKRPVFLLGLALFSGFSLVAGLAGTNYILLAGRAGQGVGAALIMPAALAILSEAFPDDRERSFAVGFWGTAIGASLAVGPALGGLISQQWFWGGVFLINVPLGALAIAVGVYAIAPYQGSKASEKLDLPGVSLSFIGLLGITYALISSNYVGWASPSIIVPLAAGALAWLVFCIVEKRSDSPMIDFGIFRNLVFTGGTLALFFWAFSISGVAAFTSLCLQDVLNLSPISAGLSYLPMALLMMASAPLSAPLARQFSVPLTVAVGYIMTAGGVCWLISLGTHSRVIDVLPEFALIGVGSGLTMPMQAAVIGALSNSWAGAASAVLNESREVAALLGLAVVSAILAARRSAALSHGATQAAAFLDGYHAGLIAATIALLAGAGVAVLSLLTKKSVSEGQGAQE